MDNETSSIQLIPSNEGITVIYHSYKTIDFVSTEIEYGLKLINDIPLIIFRFADPEENFFVPINYPALLKSENNGWINKLPIVFALRRFLMPDTLDVRKPLLINLSISDSEILKEACLAQSGKSVEWVDAAIDHIYDNDVKDYEWLY